MKTVIDYGYDRLERVTVNLEEREARKALAELAAKKVLEDGVLSAGVDGWGRTVMVKEWHDGVGVNSGVHYVVTFTRKVKEERHE